MFFRSFALRTLQRCPTASLSVHFLRPSRPFSSASRLFQTAKPTGSPPRPSQTSQPLEDTLKFAGRRPAGLGRLQLRVSKAGEVLLFEAPSHRGYILVAYSIGTFSFAYAIINSQMTLGDPNAQLPMWQKSLFSGVCILMSIMGTVFLSRTTRLIRKITAVNTDGGLRLRFWVRSMVPFRRPWQVECNPRQVAFSRQLVIDPKRLANDPRFKHQATEQTKFYKAPIQALSRAFFRVFVTVRQVFTQEDFILLEIQGQRGAFRMDANGYVANDLLLIGNPVTMKPSL
ncbi:hypothetical protein VTN31DRAFT_4677 [Thermomyces dupontii]|uniref:uncharacterized protein n=1 Tax=Talaromyces thermophilus TaxID=28565 RepID=UPI0037426C3B